MCVSECTCKPLADAKANNSSVWVITYLGPKLSKPPRDMVSWSLSNVQKARREGGGGTRCNAAMQFVGVVLV